MPIPLRRHLEILFAIVSITGLVTTGAAFGRDEEAARPHDDQAQRIKLHPHEQHVIRSMYDSPDWPFRAIALARLDGFTGEGVEALVRTAVTDDAWQVRCFALRQAHRLQLDLPADIFVKEADGRVVRTALRLGYDVAPDKLDPLARELLESHNIDDLLLGIELARFSTNRVIHGEGSRRVSHIVKDLEQPAVGIVMPRIARALEIRQNVSPDELISRLRSRRDGVRLPSAREHSVPPRGADSAFAEMSTSEFTRLGNYLGCLKQHERDLVFVIERGVSNAACDEFRARADALILFMNELSSSLQVAAVAYRTNTVKTPPVWEGEQFTTDVRKVRKFLLRIQFPQSALIHQPVDVGLKACRALQWRETADRMIVVWGALPVAEEDASKLRAELDWCREQKINVHTLQQPLVLGGQPSKVWIERTQQTYSEIARRTGGKSILLENSDIVTAVMHCITEPHWHDAFDEFYRLYIEVCQ